MGAILGLTMEALIKSIFRFLITNNKELGGLSKTVLDSVVSDLTREGGNRLSEWLNGFNFRMKRAVKDSLQSFRKEEAERIEKDLEMLFRTVSAQPLSLPEFYDEDTFFHALKKRYENMCSGVSETEMQNFCRVLRDITPLILKEKENDTGYVCELMQECLRNILSVRQGTEELMRRFDDLCKVWAEEREKPELPEQKFYRLWNQALQAGNNFDSKEAEAYEQILVFLNEKINAGTFDDLCLALPGPVEGINNPLPEFMCTGCSKRLPLFYAQAQIRLAQAYVNERKNEKRKVIDRHLALKRLEQAEQIVKVSRADNSIISNESERCMLFCDRCVEAIESARAKLEAEEQKSMEKVPAVRINHSDDVTAVFEPVFGGCFDSVAGCDEDSLDDLELNIFQLAAGGKTILLQGPQIVDNRNMLKLLHKTEFGVLCKLGIVAFSSYGNFKNTNEFIKSRLNNPAFKFSSFPEYNRSDMGPALRRIVLDGLNSGRTFREIEGDIPRELRGRMEMIYDGYWIADECFRKIETLKYHQNPALRTGKFHLSGSDSDEFKQGLPGAIHKKIGQLAEDQELVPIKKREEYIRYFKELEQLAGKPDHEGNFCRNRSDYDHMIDDLKKRNIYDKTVLEMFRSLVHTCYLLYNGKLSCDKVIIPMQEPVLCIHHKSQKLQQSIFRVDYAYKRYKRMSEAEQNIVGWKNIAECVLNAREVMADPAVLPEKKAMMMHRATGLIYTTALDQTVNVAEMSAKVSDGKQIDLSDRAFNTEILGAGDTQECY